MAPLRIWRAGAAVLKPTAYTSKASLGKAKITVPGGSVGRTGYHSSMYHCVPCASERKVPQTVNRSEGNAQLCMYRH